MPHPLDPIVPALAQRVRRLAKCPVTVRRENWGGCRVVIFTMHGPRLRHSRSPEYDVTLALVRYCHERGLPAQVMAESAPGSPMHVASRSAARARRPRVATRPTKRRRTSPPPARS